MVLCASSSTAKGEVAIPREAECPASITMEETSKPGKKSPETPSEEKSHKSETNTPEGSDTWTKPCGAASDNEKPESVPNEKKARKVKVRRRNRDSKSSRHRQPARKGNPSQSESGSESDGKRGSGKRKAKVGRSVSSESSGSREEPSSKSSDSDSDDSVEKSNTPMLFRFRYSNVQTQQSRPLRPSSKNPFQEFVRVQKVPPPGRVMEVYVTIFGNRMVEPFENKATHFVEDNLGTRPDMVRIYGSKLIRLLQRVVGRYPGVSLKGNFIDISMPYLMLAHHYEELNKILEDHKPVAQSDKAGSKVGEDGAAASTDATGKEAAASTTSTTAAAAVPVATTATLTAANLEAHNSQQSEEYDEETIKELDMLMMWFRPVWEDKYAESSARLASGVCTYEDLPFLFRPNTAVYVARSGALEGYLVGSVRYNARLDRRSGIEQEYRKQISLISLEYNRRRVRTSTCYVWIRKFRGERDIRSLTVFPARYYDDQDGGKLAAKLIERGRLYYRIVRSIPAYMQYDGYAWYMESNNMIPRKNPDLVRA